MSTSTARDNFHLAMPHPTQASLLLGAALSGNIFWEPSMRTLIIAIALVVMTPAAAQDQPKANFDPKKIEKLLDERAAKRSDTKTKIALDQDEINGLRARLYSLWSPPAAALIEVLRVTVRIRLSREGSISAPPIVLTPGASETFKQFRDSAVRAVLVGQPYTMLKAEHYEAWKEIDFRFDSSNLSKQPRSAPAKSLN